jgi:hypothetical protein
MNVTLVAFYDAKPSALEKLLQAVQGRLAGLGRGFQPYALEQVHATLVGLEGFRHTGSDRIISANYQVLRDQSRVIQLDAIFDLLRTTEQLPLDIQLGGFREDQAYSFESRGEPPFQRAFSVQGSQAVVMGWPCSGASHSRALGLLRRELEALGALHKYHGTPGALDNDLFFVLGRIDRPSVDRQRLADLSDEIRVWLAQTALHLSVSAAQLSVVGYLDPALPRDQTVCYRLAEADADEIAKLYGAEASASPRRNSLV